MLRYIIVVERASFGRVIRSWWQSLQLPLAPLYHYLRHHYIWM